MVKTVKLRRLWNNIASLRDCDVAKYVEQGCTLKITVAGRDDYMILTPDILRQKAFQAVDQEFASSFIPGMKYKLIDFAWKPEGK